MGRAAAAIGGHWNEPVGQDLSPYDSLRLWLRLAQPGPVRVGLSSDDPSVSFTPVVLDSLPTDQWIHVQLSLAELGAAGAPAGYIRVANYTSEERTLWVDQWELSGDGGPPILTISTDSLAAPWFNSSWDAVVDFADTGRVYSGPTAIKTALQGWGGLRVHAGSWDYPAHPEISPYDSLRFHIWPDSVGPVRVGMSSEAGGSFEQVLLEGLPAGQWSPVAIPLDQLSPGGDRPDQIYIKNYIAGSRTLWVDNWELTRPVSVDHPIITLSTPPDGYQTDSASVRIAGTVTDTTESVSLMINDQPVPLSPDGSFEHEAGLFPGDNYYRLKAVNADSSMRSKSVKIVRNYITDIPPDPSTVAPPLDSSVVTTLYHSTEFLFKGDSLIQYGVGEGTIKPGRAGVIRGKVLDTTASPLDSVMITILDHPEYGYTFTRPDGRFDMAVNGGGPLTLRYHHDSHLPVQRQVQVPWQGYARADSVVMTGLDPNLTTIDFSDTLQVARGSVMSDADGARQATLMFEQGTNATMVLPDGSTQQLSSLDVRATEYTVGEKGPAAMPAQLPPTSGYTYAAEFSADQALQAGASEVRFDKPVAFYLENFVGFPTGTAVPVGYYDRKLGEWIASENGLVIEITSTSGGLAGVDLDGDGTGEPADSLAAAGIDSTERQRLASLYSAGQTLWRTEITHFTPWDCNFPYGPPRGCRSAGSTPAGVEPPW